MSARLIIPAILGFGLSAAAAAQGSDGASQAPYSYTPDHSYSSDYEVGTWSEQDRSRASYGRVSPVDASAELLGGPVPSYGSDVGINRPQRTARSSGYENVRVVMTDALQARMEQQQAQALAPGTAVETSRGMPVGRISNVERNSNGDITSAWVRPPNSNSGALREIPVRAIRFQNGRAVVEAG